MPQVSAIQAIRIKGRAARAQLFAMAASPTKSAAAA